MKLYITSRPEDLTPDYNINTIPILIRGNVLYLGVYYISIRATGWWLFYK